MSKMLVLEQGLDHNVTGKMVVTGIASLFSALKTALKMHGWFWW